MENKQEELKFCAQLKVYNLSEVTETLGTMPWRSSSSLGGGVGSHGRGAVLKVKMS